MCVSGYIFAHASSMFKSSISLTLKKKKKHTANLFLHFQIWNCNCDTLGHRVVADYKNKKRCMSTQTLNPVDRAHVAFTLDSLSVKTQNKHLATEC